MSGTPEPSGAAAGSRGGSAALRRGGNLIFLGISQAFRLGAGFVVNVIVMRALGVEPFGIYGYVTTLVGLFAFGSYMGMDRLLNAEISRDESLLPRSVAAGLLATALLSTVTAAAIVGWAWLGDGRPLVVTAAAVGALALGLRSLAMMPVASFHALRRMGLGAGGHIVGRMVLVAATLVLLQAGLDVVAVFGAQVIDALVTLGIILVVYAREVGRLPLRQGAAEVPGLLRRSVPFGLNALFTSVYLSVDVIMLQQMRGEAEVGLYRAATIVIALLPQVADTITTGVFPRMARHLGDPAAAGEELTRTARVLLAISMPAAVGGVVLAEPLVVLMGGEEFAAASVAFVIMAPMIPLRFLKNAYGMTLSSLNRQADRTRGVFWAAAFNILANLYAIPRWGAAGAAFTTLLTDVGLLLWKHWRMAPLLEGYRVLPMVARAALPSLLMGGVLLLLPPFHVLLQVAVGALVYAVLGNLVGAWHPRDLRWLRRV